MPDEFAETRVAPPERLLVDALGYVWQDGAEPGHLSMARTTDRNISSPGLLQYRRDVTTEWEYTPAEMMSALRSIRRYLADQHQGVCIGCDKCTQISMLDIAESYFGDLARGSEEDR